MRETREAGEASEGREESEAAATEVEQMESDEVGRSLAQVDSWVGERRSVRGGKIGKPVERVKSHDVYREVDLVKRGGLGPLGKSLH